MKGPCRLPLYRTRRRFRSRHPRGAEAVASGRQAIDELLQSLSEFVSGLVGINLSYDRTAGDRILRLLAQVVEEQTRVDDFVCRYGGEEFAVLLPESTIDRGRYVADKVRQAVGNMSLRHERARIKVTVSAGVGQVNREKDTPETFVGPVDAALCEAKANERNRVELTLG